MKQTFISRLKTIHYPYTIEGDLNHSFPHILGLRFHGVEGQWLMIEANRQGLYFSTGSACHVQLQEPTPTMKALGRTNEEAFEFIRFTFGKQTTTKEIDEAIQILSDLLSQFYKE